MIILQILIIAALFTLVVGAHELGHFLFARWRGMEVEEFAIGFGPKVVSRKDKRGTEFTLRALPLGGFVRIKGMEPKADGSEVGIASGFYSKGLWSRALVLFAGPLFSFLFGWVLFFGDAAAFGWQNAPYIGSVENGSVAEAAGIKGGDRILKAGDKHMRAFTDFGDVIQEAKGKPIDTVLLRDGKEITTTITAEFRRPDVPAEVKNSDEYKESAALRKKYEEKRWLVGIVGERSVPVGIIGAASIATSRTWFITSETAKIFAAPARLAKEAGGVITIGKAAGQAVERGFSYFLALSALISVSLGIINLLPIPLMDGGQLMVVFLEWLRGGRRLSMKTQEVLGFVGLVIIAALFLTVTYLDIGRLAEG